MRRVGLALLFAILGWFTVSNSGCLWLAVPELAYEGYKAEEKKPDNQSAQKSSKAQTQPASSMQQTDTGTDTSIE